LALLLLLAGGLFAQKQADEAVQADASHEPTKMAIGFGLEWNMNSRDYFAGGAVFGFDYNLPLPIYCAAGLSFGVSYNFNDSTVLEPQAFFRWYFMDVFTGVSGAYERWFIQADFGCTIIMEKECKTIPLFLGGLRAGYRLPLGDSFYIEPSGRLGYPFAFGIGVMGGYRFGGAKQ